MNNGLNTTQNVSNTRNPQGSAGVPGGNDAEDFQAPADQQTLNQQTESLSVQQTGEAITGVDQPADGGLSTGWMLLIGIAVVIAIVVVVKIIRDIIEEDRASVRPPTQVKKKSSTASKQVKAKAKPAKRVSRTGKKKSKKPTKKRK